ncbi:MAG: hypothetical protein HRT68_16690 [Flavobacteriaceae bacterium]|nr:hypothetical protein [Flavobacteriaceae bacterium]
MLLEGDNRDHYIEQYVKGKLSPEETFLFEQKMKDDPELAEEVKFMKELFIHFDTEGWNQVSPSADTKELKEFFRSDQAMKIKMALESAEVEYEKTKKRKFPRFIAASVIGLMVFLSGYLIATSNNNLYDSYYSTGDMPSLVSREGAANKVGQIATSFQNKDFSKTIGFVKEYVNNSKEVAPNVYLYSGMAYLNLEKYDEAIQEFKKLSTSDHIDSSKGLWFEALAHMKVKNKTAMTDVLKKIASDSINFNYTKAKEILEDLD